jgi:hypothetical protein
MTAGVKSGKAQNEHISVLPLKANVRSARLMSRCPQARKHPFADCELPGRVELLPTGTMCVETVCR